MKDEVDTLPRSRITEKLNKILDEELSGVLRYLSCSFRAAGPQGIPLRAWFDRQASQCLQYARETGELVFGLDGSPSLCPTGMAALPPSEPLLMLRRCADHEERVLALYRELLDLVRGCDASLEDWARRKLDAVDAHLADIEELIGSVSGEGGGSP